ncbi:MAG TPA: type II toxin-antitoxin system VapC family toxin [Verrucomicrobiae bacterium]|nr:type II toxin-antitoxin system VapC family toxin [Verrucomicrobiae bacterium]
MNASWVIDSSVGFAWIHPSQATDATNSLLDDVEAGAAITVPVLWFSEIANSLLVLQRRKKLTGTERKTALETLSKLTFAVDEEAVKTAFGKTSELAEQYNLSVHDATYLELAIRRKLPLASRDDALNDAAKKAGVEIL